MVQRRTILKSIGGSALGLAASTTVGAAKDDTDGIYVWRQGSLNNPVGKKEIDKLVKRARKKYFATYKRQMETDGLYIHVPRLQKASKLIGYGIYVSPDGRARTFVGTVPDPEAFSEDKPDVKAARRRVRKDMRNFEQEIVESPPYSTTSVSWDDFDIDANLGKAVGTCETSGGDTCPTGEFVSNSAIYQHNDSDKVFATATEIDIIPGDAGCQNSWKKDKYWGYQQWQSGSFDTGRVTDWSEPTSGESTYGVEVTFGGDSRIPSVTIGASETIPNTTITSNSNSEQGAWVYNFSGSDQDGSDEYNVASFCEFDSAPSSGDQIVEVENEVRFDKWDYYKGRDYSDRATCYYYPN